MRCSQIWLLVLLAVAGCKGDGIGPKIDNPVVGPPPPRRIGAETSEASEQFARDEGRRGSRSESDGDVAQTSLSDSSTSVANPLEGNRVVATINGAPIFEAEILERYAEPLAKMREAAPADEYHRQTELLIERDLPSHVEQKLLSEAMRRSLKKDQKKQLDEFTKKQLKEQLDRMKQDLGVNSTAELDRELQKKGTSLAMIEHQFRNRTLAQQYLASKLTQDRKLSRQDLFAYYQQHKKDYEFKRRAKWQQVLISRSNESQAKAKLKILTEGISEGRDFGELAKEISDGPTAENSGIYGWTNSGSLADRRVEQAIFKQDIGEISDIISSPESYQVVRVLAREEAGHTPFDEVQDKIREKLQSADHENEVATLIDQLWADATIDSPYKIELGKRK